MKNFLRTLVLGCSTLALAGCGADEIVSPGTGGNINIENNNPPAPAPTPTPTPTSSLVTPAADCPDIFSTGGLANQGTIEGPTGEYRVCRLPTVIDRSDTLPFIPGLLYNLGGQVFVGNDAGFDGTGTGAGVVLTVEPGVIVYGTGQQALVVRRGNRLISNGTADRPIVWTSRDNVTGVATDDSQQQWGGVVLLGRARVSDCATGGVNTDGTFSQNPQCQQNLEGAATTIPYGGPDDEDSSGSFTFNQIRFSGFELAPGNELQSLTTGGVGSLTAISNLQSFNSSDDGVEFFGGTFEARNLAVIGAADDSLDVDTGARVDLDTVLAVQRTTQGNSLIELDSGDSPGNPSNAFPRTNFQVNNFTFVARSPASISEDDVIVRARGGAALSLTNGVMQNLPEGIFCFRIDEQVTLDNLIGIDSVVCNGGTSFAARGTNGISNADVLNAVTAGTNVDLAFTITLSGIVNGANETGVTVFDPTGRSSFFPARTFIGAVPNTGAIATTFGNWTCNSATVDFGSSNGACTSLPVYD